MPPNILLNKETPPHLNSKNWLNLIRIKSNPIKIRICNIGLWVKEFKRGELKSANNSLKTKGCPMSNNKAKIKKTTNPKKYPPKRLITTMVIIKTSKKLSNIIFLKIMYNKFIFYKKLHYEKH